MKAIMFASSILFHLSQMLDLRRIVFGRNAGPSYDSQASPDTSDRPSASLRR